MINETHCDEFAERLADLLERDVDETTRAALESHALSCGDCGAMLADMRKLRIDAANLPALTPSRDLWEGIAQRIDAPVIPLRGNDRGAAHRAGRWRRWGQLAAAAAVLIAVTSTSTYYLTRRGLNKAGARVASTEPSVASDSMQRTPTDSLSAVTPFVAARSDSVPLSSTEPKAAQPTPSAGAVPGARLASNKPSAEQVYMTEIARLHTIVERRRTQLDPVTISVIERNLKVIDDAIAQCRLALAKDPASRFLMESLNTALENKVQLLRTATMLPARS